ncbi:MAG: M20/M25/M40 family metallo-hydrolase [Chloroflexi bacterium]|nr:M20/M25/M40 family metallo-hydrolase [Chloroflexota bacterium]
MTWSKWLDSLRWPKVGEELLDILCPYLRIDTTNPPGDVAAAAGYLQAALEREGLPVTRLDAAAGQANLAATLNPGREPCLVLAHHMDVVPAVRENWSFDPFGGECRDGFLLGRGTLDMKGFGAMQLLAFLLLARAEVPLAGSLRLLATADEEVGGIDGAKWLAENHFDEAGGDYLLTEGSFGNLTPAGRIYYPTQVAEKGVSTVKLVTRGKAAHASSPSDDNAVVRMAAALSRLAVHSPARQATDIVRTFLKAVTWRFPGLTPEKVDAMDGETMHELLGSFKESKRAQVMLRNTYTVTIVKGGVAENVVPPYCEAMVDCRTLPGVSSDELLEELASVLGPEVEMSLAKESTGTESPLDTPLYRAIEETVRSVRPEAYVMPILTPGGTDCKHFRPRGVVCYGLVPFELAEGEDAGIHGADEKVSIENLKRGMKILLGIILRTIGKD